MAFDGEIVSRDKLQKAASEMKGSQDLASQLFCCMLRSIGVDTRLVCSLQALDFASRPIPASQRLQKTVVYAESSARRQNDIHTRSPVKTISRQNPRSFGRIKRFGGNNTSKHKSSSNVATYSMAYIEYETHSILNFCRSPTYCAYHAISCFLDRSLQCSSTEMGPSKPLW